MKTMNDHNDLDPAIYAADLAKTIAAQQAKMDSLPDWWQQVLMELHDRMQCEFLWNQEYEDAPNPSLLQRRTVARFCSHYAEIYEAQPPKITRRDNECPVCSKSTQTASGELTGNPHSPDCEYLKPQYIPPAELPDYFKLPGMEHKRMDLMDWRFNGIEARIGTLESNASAFRLTALEERLSALEEWADIEYAPVDGNPPDSIHDLIAEGMTGVTSHCQESAAALVTVAVAATDKRIDAVVQQADLLQSLLLNVKALVLNIDARINTLEAKAPC